MSIIEPVALSDVQSLCWAGQYLDAFHASESWGPLKTWEGPDAKIVAGRMCQRLGNPNLGHVLFYTAHRQFPDHFRARYYRVAAAFARFGPWSNWRLINRLGDPDSSVDDQERADWHTHKAFVLGFLRDFERAESELAFANEILPDRPWQYVVRSSVYEFEDRYDESLEAAQHAMALEPNYDSAVHAAADAFLHLGRDRDAQAILEEGTARIQSGSLMASLATLYGELDEHEKAMKLFDDIERLTPLGEKRFKQWLAARRSDTAYQLERYDECIEYAKAADPEFYELVAEGIAQAPADAKRVQVDVPFVKQHHVTCTPATLASIAKFWSAPAEHLEIAEKICYDGTPEPSKRFWAEENGFVVREFLVDWESAGQLIDRGVPFALTTRAASFSHSQAVFGYDSRRRTLLIRDPTERFYREYLTKDVLKPHAGGPRGMVLLPQEQSHLIDGLQLPDAELFDVFYQMQRSLESHDREAACARLDELVALDGQHTLVIEAKAALANYDVDLTKMLGFSEQLLEHFPDDDTLQVTRIGCLRALGRRDDRLRILKELCAKEKADPYFWQSYAEELGEDARLHDQSQYWLRRVIRAQPQSGRNYYALAGLHWDLSDRELAYDAYRFAVSLDDKNESFARSLFIASRYLNRKDEALQFLRDRFERFGEKSSLPATTLVWALVGIDQPEQASKILDRALELRPQDGDLKLAIADFLVGQGECERAAELLEDARGTCYEPSWLRSAAYHAAFTADLSQALAYWRQVAERQPVARDAQEMIAKLLSDTEGRHAALEHLRELVGQQPHNCSFRQLFIEWLRDDGSAQVEEAVRAYLELQPDDAWARRELAVALCTQGRMDAALEEANIAVQLEPSFAPGYFIRGDVHEQSGRIEAAREDYRESIRRSVDFDRSIRALIAVSRKKSERDEELRFIYDQFVKQPIFGDGLLAWWEVASGRLEASEILESLREAQRQRSDLWQVWTALGQQLTTTGDLDAALQVAMDGTDRFPLIPRLWLDLALVRRARDERQEEIEALQKTLEINPGWTTALIEMAEAYQRQGDFEAAKECLLSLLKYEPNDPAGHSQLAHVEWITGEREAAVSRIESVVKRRPDSSWAWERLYQLSLEMQTPERPVELARALAEARPNESLRWTQLAQVLTRPNERDEQRAAIARAIELDPYNVASYETQADILASDGDYDAALTACRPAVFDGQPPLLLQARMAEIMYRFGNAAGAIDTMQGVLELDRDYVWAWSNLVDWYRQLDRNEEYLEAAENLARVSPDHSVTWGYLGDARSRAEDREGARDAYRRAVHVDPEYAFGRRMLVDLFLADKQFDEANEAITEMKPFVEPAEVQALGIRLAIALEQSDRALELLADMCREPTANYDLLSVALESLTEANQDEAALQCLLNAVQSGNANEDVPVIWMRQTAKLGMWRPCLERLEEWTDLEASWNRAANELLFAAIDANDIRLVRKMLNRYREKLHADDLSWAVVGSAYCRLEQDGDAVKWMSDWKGRLNLSPQILYYLSASYWNIGSRKAGADVCRYAITLPPDGATPSLEAFVAFDELMDGNLLAARAHLDRIDPEPLDEFYQFLWHYSSILCDALLRPEDECDRTGEVAVMKACAKIERQFGWSQSRNLVWNYLRIPLSRVAFRYKRPLVGILRRCFARY